MGWGWLGRIGSAVWSGVKTVAKKTVEVAKKTVEVAVKCVKKVGAAVQSGYEKFTGRDKEREAEGLLAAMEEKAKTKEREFKAFADKIQQRVNKSVERINELRSELNDSIFRRFEETAANFSTWDVVAVRLELARDLPTKSLEPLKTRGELFKIDFRNHPVKSNLQAIFTLGFLTRKRAKETLDAVKEEEHRLDEDIARLEAEKKRLQLVAEALEEVVYFVTGFKQYYVKIIDELDYSVCLLRSWLSLQTQGEVQTPMDPAMLPDRHKDCLKCADEATRIMHKICKLRYVENSNDSIQKLDSDFNSFKEGKKQMERIKESFAA